MHNNTALEFMENTEIDREAFFRRLMEMLEQGRRSGEEKGWIPAGEVRARLEERFRG